jgi:ribonuclease Z
MILTTADILKTAVSNAKAVVKGKKPEVSGPLPGLDVIGPAGTQQFIHSLRHFMRRDAYQVTVREGAYAQTCNNISKKRKRNGEVNEEYFSIESIVCLQKRDSKTTGTSPQEPSHGLKKQVLSFLFTSPPIQGKFLTDRAKSLGIPPGPLYGQLKNGKSVTFTDNDGKDHTVESHQVVEPGSPSISTAVLYYPSIEVLEQLRESEQLRRLRERGPKDPLLELVVHIAPMELFSSALCKEWTRSFEENVQHMYVESGASGTPEEKTVDNVTPFLSATAGAFARGQLSGEIYGSFPPTPSQIHMKRMALDDEKVPHTRARPLLEYVIVPRSKKGFQNHFAFDDAWMKLKAGADELVRSSAADTRAREILGPKSELTVESQGELIFTGTGSALPCKHRNVSGIFLRMANGNSMLLDVGEGTIGQLLQVRHSESCRRIVEEIKAVWISHPHADHHLGIIRLLEERSKITRDPLTLIAPTNLDNFLREYEKIDPSILGSYTFVNCRDLTPIATKSNMGDKLKKLEVDLGITSCTAIPVAHCPNSFAVILGGTPFGSLAYSGDCRPSMPFAAAAVGVDLLIHEATFADGMEAEATVKRHCTVGEALHVGREMKAKTVVLTHFSQRYPKIPPLSPDGNSAIEFPVVFAFDYAKLSPSTLVPASKLTPALRLLYPETETTVDEEDTIAAAALDIPGIFAQKSIL